MAMEKAGIYARFCYAREQAVPNFEDKERVMLLLNQSYWEIYQSDLHDYCFRFKDVIPGDLENEIREKRKKQPTFGLELAGYGYMFSNDIFFDRGVYTALADPLPILNPELRHARTTYLHGDVLSGLTWNRLQTKRANITENKGFDLIVFSPESSSTVIGGGCEPSDGLMTALIRRCWSLLSPDEGVLLFGYNSVASKLEEWVTPILQSGIVARYSKSGSRNRLLLMKQSGSPVTLPTTKQVSNGIFSLSGR